MIAFKGGALKNGRRQGVIPSFGKAIHYLHYGTYEEPASISPPPNGESRVAWATTRNLLNEDPWLAIPQMEAVASQNLRAKKPGYHMGASLPPGETLDQAQWEEVADAMLAKLGLEEHQAVIALHDDKGHQHMHVIANRVAFEGHVWKPSFDERKLTQVMREMERRFDLRRVPTRDRAAGRVPPTRAPEIAWDEKRAASRICRVLGDDLRRARTWAEVDELLASHGIEIKPARCGGGAMAHEGGHQIRMSEIDRALSGPKLARRFGTTLRAYLAERPERPRVASNSERIETSDALQEAERIIDDLELRHASWTERDVRIAAAHRHDFDDVLGLVLHHERVQRVALDSNGDIRFATKDSIADESLFFESAKRLARSEAHGLRWSWVAERLGDELTEQQRKAVREATSGEGDLAIITGGADTGKTTVASAAARVYRQTNRDVIGIAPTARAAQELADTAGIDARSLDAWRYAWRAGRAEPRRETIFFVDDAGQIETRRMARLLARIDEVEGKAILVGDADGLQPIGPGAPFRGLAQHFESVELAADRLTLQEWEREAHASGDLADVIDAYQDRDRFAWTEDRASAIDAVAREVLRESDEGEDATVVALASTREEVDAIHREIRTTRRDRGELEETADVRSIDVGAGDRVRFLQGDRSGAFVSPVDRDDEPVIVAGELGTVLGIEDGQVVVTRDRGGDVCFDPADYDHLDHAYALTIHQAAARKLDRTVVLLGRHADRHQARVALSRHRQSTRIVADRQTFRTNLDLDRLISRDRGKDLISDYGTLAMGDTDPEKALDIVRRLASHEATWSRDDFIQLAGKDRHLVDHLETSSDVIALPSGDYTTWNHLDNEILFIEGAARIAATATPEVDAPRIESLAKAHDLSGEQQRALAHVAERRLALITGRAGSGKTRLTRAMVEHFDAQGMRVRGAALAGKAADGLAQASGIEAQTLAAWQAGWQRSEGHLSASDVFIIDEASMVDVRTMAKVTWEVERSGARLVLIGDPAQLQPIGAGDAFRALLDRHASASLGEVRRQRHARQVEASKHASEGRFDEAVKAYIDHGVVHHRPSQRDTERMLVHRYLRSNRAGLDNSIVLAHRRHDMRVLNHEIHEARHRSGEIRGGIRFKGREFSVGDRIILGANDPDGKRVEVLEGEVGVRNGALGTIEDIERGRLMVRLDDGRRIAFDPREYQRFDHGYATTIHKAQGVTVDNAYLYASKSLDRASAYVGLTRHRERLEVFVSAREFETREDLVEAMSRLRSKGLVLDQVNEGTARNLLGASPSRAVVPDVERQPIALDSRLLKDALGRALARYRLHDELESEVEALSKETRELSRLIGDRSTHGPLRAVFERLPSIYPDPLAAQHRIQSSIRNVGHVRSLRGLGEDPNFYGPIHRHQKKAVRAYAQELSEWAIDQHETHAEGTDEHRRLEERQERFVAAFKEREALPDRDELRQEVGILANAVSEEVLRPLPEGDRQIIEALQNEQRELLRTARKSIKALGTDASRIAGERFVDTVRRTALRHALHKVSPPALRSLMRLTSVARSPTALLIQMAPPQLRPLLYIASAARSIARSRSESRGMGR